MQERMVPTEAIRDLTRGSFEHLAFRIKEAIQESREMFVGKSHVELAGLATFPGYVLVGSADGDYFRAKYEDVQGRIRIMIPEKIDVPVIGRGNAQNYVREFAMATVDAILSGNKEESSDRLLALVKLTEDVEEEIDDLAGSVIDHLKGKRFWRALYQEQKAHISEQIKDLMESIRSNGLDIKYVPLYDGTIPEEKFDGYRDNVMGDLRIVADRLEKIQTRAESAYIPFSEAVANITRTAEEDQTLSQFGSFADDFFSDLGTIREHVAFGMKNEQCVMCLGQVHDAIVETLMDYEIAGSFIEHMAKRFTDAK